MHSSRGGDDPFTQANRSFERLAANETAATHIAWHSILMSHERRTPRSYVLLHGLTASPLQFADFGRMLYEGGANVFIPRLPRHGHNDRLSRALAGLTVGDLENAAREAVRIGRGLGEHVTVVGFSAGGLMSAWVAQHLDVDRVVSIAAFFGVGWLPPAFAPWVTKMTLRLPNRFLWWNPIKRERHGAAHGYPRFPTHAIGRAWQLALSVLAAAEAGPPATKEIALVSNAGETTVNNSTMARLAGLWSLYPGVSVETYRLEGLPRSHDIIEPRRRRPLAALVYPALLPIVTK